MSDRPLTTADLAEAGACMKETTLFKEIFGEGNICTYERVMSVALKFDWPFAARHLLTEAQQRHFKTLIALAFKNIDSRSDRTQEKRRRAMANAFYKAYNGPTE